MSLMLVSYAKCGCRMSALLDGKEDLNWREFVSDEALEGRDVREEEHEEIGVSRCSQHPPGDDELLMSTRAVIAL